VSPAVPFGAVLRSEWTKLRTVRSTWWCAAVYVVSVAATGWLAAATTPHAARPGDALSAAFTGFGVGQLVLVVLGVLAVTAEFGTGMALASFAAVPRRTRLLAAKTLVVAAVSGVLTAVLALVCSLAARTLTAVPGGVDLLAPAVLRPVAVQTLAAVLVAVLAVALGTLLRSSAGGVSVGFALVFVLPPVLALAGGRLGGRLSQGLPALRVGEETFLAVPTTWLTGLLVALAWAVAGWAACAVLLERRDL
jgi:ABC-2 type transport system permease protein